VTQVNIHEAKTNLSKLVKQVENGEEVVLARGGKPVARLVRLEPRLPPRELGLCKGEFVVPDDFNDPLSDEELELFYK
jgi:prevent-host-death family protein